MSTINSTSNSSYNWYTQNSTQGQNKVHHGHHKSKEQDVSQLSQVGTLQSTDSLQDIFSSSTQDTSSSSIQGVASTTTQSGTSTTTSNPLDSLVATGTITQDQVNSIKSAFQSDITNNQ